MMGATRVILKALKHTPQFLVRRMAGAPWVIDGNVLDANTHLLAKLAARAVPDGEPTLAERRAAAAVFARDANAPRARGVRSYDRTIPTAQGDLPARIYTPKGKTPAKAILFFHQGGLVVFDLETNDTFCSILAAECGAQVISLDYRLAPEHKFPAAIDDAVSLWDFVQENAAELELDPTRIAVCGDSAGGLMSATLCQILRERGGTQPVAQCLVYPWVVVDMGEQGSMGSCANAFPLSREVMEYFSEQCFVDAAQHDHPHANPLKNPDLSGLPPAIVATAGFDPIRDQGNAYAAALEKAGVSVTHFCFGELSHSFLIMGNVSHAATRASRHVARALAARF